MKKTATGVGTTSPTRRDVLRFTAVGLVAGAVAPMLSLFSPTDSLAASAGNARILVVYYSRSGNTREIATQIHARVGGDLAEIQTVTPYPAEYRQVTEQAKEELRTGYRPPLTTKIADMGAYDIVFEGSPCWWGTVATPVWTFLSDYDFSGKTIAPFMTHGGSGLGRSMADIKALCPNAKVLDGLAVWGREARAAQGDVSGWLREIGIQG